MKNLAEFCDPTHRAEHNVQMLAKVWAALSLNGESGISLPRFRDLLSVSSPMGWYLDIPALRRALASPHLRVTQQVDDGELTPVQARDAIVTVATQWALGSAPAGRQGEHSRPAPVDDAGTAPTSLLSAVERGEWGGLAESLTSATDDAAEVPKAVEWALTRV